MEPVTLDRVVSSPEPDQYEPYEAGPPPVSGGMSASADQALVTPPAPAVVMLTHGGLITVDPWAPERRPLRTVLWPWGLAGVAETLEVIALALIMFVAVRSVAHN